MDYSRRAFLKLSGRSLGVAAALASLLTDVGGRHLTYEVPDDGKME